MPDDCGECVIRHSPSRPAGQTEPAQNPRNSASAREMRCATHCLTADPTRSLVASPTVKHVLTMGAPCDTSTRHWRSAGRSCAAGLRRLVAVLAELQQQRPNLAADGLTSRVAVSGPSILPPLPRERCGAGPLVGDDGWISGVRAPHGATSRTAFRSHLEDIPPSRRCSTAQNADACAVRRRFEWRRHRPRPRGPSRCTRLFRRRTIRTVDLAYARWRAAQPSTAIARCRPDRARGLPRPEGRPRRSVASSATLKLERSRFVRADNEPAAFNLVKDGTAQAYAQNRYMLIGLAEGLLRCARVG